MEFGMQTPLYKMHTLDTGDDLAQIDLTQPHMQVNQQPLITGAPHQQWHSTPITHQITLEHQLQSLLFNYGISLSQPEIASLLSLWIQEASHKQGARFSHPHRALSAGTSGMGHALIQTPRAEVLDKKAGWKILVELSNVRPINVHVERFQDKLIIKAKQTSQLNGNEQLKPEESVLLNEIEATPIQYYREIKLGFLPKPNQIQSHFENGVLEINIQKPANCEHYEQIEIK